MITPSFSLTATERVLPKLALDFTTASLDPRITFTRALATATRVNSSGYIATVAADTPRFDYDPVTLACKGLLIEESRTNSLTYSTTFATNWPTFGASIASSTTVGPDGNNAVKWVESAVTGEHGIYQSLTTSGTTVTSVYMKYNGRRYAVLRKDGLSNPLVVFDLQNGVVTQETAATGSITAFANGWYRCSIIATSTGNFVIKGSDVGTGVLTNSTYTGDGVSGFFMYGAQCEAGAFATSYIPTTTTALTRNADVATMTGTNFSSWYNQSQGSFFVESLSCAAAGARFISVTQATSGLTADNTIFIDAAGNIRGVVYSGSTAVAVMLSGARPALGTLTRSVIGYAVDNYATSLNGAAPATDNAGALPVVSNTQLEIGQVANGFTTTAINSHMRKISYWPQRLTNAEVQAFSK